MTASDRPWVRATLQRTWAATAIARRGELVEAGDLPGYVALIEGRRVGMALVQASAAEVEIVAISTSRRRRGVGRALVAACVDEARERGCRRLWLGTTNENTAAMAFYQRLGMDLCAFRRHGVGASRQVKPLIPLRDAAGVRIDHELEFELLLDPEPNPTPARPDALPAGGGRASATRRRPPADALTCRD